MVGLLADKVAIVTGAGAGIGAAIARAYGAEGARVVVSDINGEAAREVSSSIEGSIAVTADVADEEQVVELVRRTVAEFGGLHVVVPNAGIATTKPLLETSLEDWRKVMSVNLDGVFLTIRHCLPAMLDSGGGSIVNISSIASTTGSALIGSYSAAKAAVRNLTETLSAELRFQNIRANALLPGFIATDLVKSHQPDLERALGLEAGGFDNLIAAKQTRYGRTEEVAAAAVFFASDQSSWCNGSSLILDGGFKASLL
ncbi:glucose 1-dehydrogenase [Rhodococcus xishaensis]|uniref:Glucose 1-dehydrogenase n=1 Tax=Rhodococcus xishaensis TaxID=2487364 RepID=A0A3S3CPT1_9NOCA|nr:glucose 1-dehydrogenase [Rhodococcus xishaensis]RVW02760.1 glucose 1-dehydrogenase [Rhodococcus xishaensis]